MNISELKTLINEIIDPSNEMTIGETQSLKHISYDEEKDTYLLINRHVKNNTSASKHIL